MTADDEAYATPSRPPFGASPEAAPGRDRADACALTEDAHPCPAVVLLGNPNTGKTTIFNRLCGLRSRTANYPGITCESRHGRLRVGATELELIDLPGSYSLAVDAPEAEFCRASLARLPGPDGGAPDAALLVVDASNLTRNLILVAEVLDAGSNAVIALTMGDVARRRGQLVDAGALAETLDCPVVEVNARVGHGTAPLVRALAGAVAGAAPRPRIAVPASADGDSARQRWAQQVTHACCREEPPARPDLSDALDRLLVHPLLGGLAFVASMAALFAAIFFLAQGPMDAIEAAFQWAGEGVRSALPAGAVADLLVDGILGGIAGTVVFLPQICLLFFLLSLLEDTGYLARAAFLADRLLRRFGLPGQAFVPLLSAHACALPGILSARLVPDRRDRLATILVTPFLSCSARLPVYVLLVGILFPDSPLRAGLAFAGCYALGAVVALLVAGAVRSTLLRGASPPLVLELPSYKLPSLRTALLVTVDRGRIFLRKAGTVIVAICVVIWWLSAYPRSEPPAEATRLRAAAEALADDASEQQRSRRDELLQRADALSDRHQLRHSFAGELGALVEPLLAPVGCDWQLSIAVLSSFAAREVFVSTLLVTLGLDEDDPRIVERVRKARREDGRPLIDLASGLSLLVFYVLALQCLPTLAVTRREAGGWRWALLQFALLSSVAYAAAAAVHAIARVLAGGGA